MSKQKSFSYQFKHIYNESNFFVNKTNFNCFNILINNNNNVGIIVLNNDI